MSALPLDLICEETNAPIKNTNDSGCENIDFFKLKTAFFL